MNEKIEFKDLSGGLKTAVVFSYIIMCLYILGFIAGFISVLVWG